MKTHYRRIMIWVPVIAAMALGLAYAFAPRPVAVDLLTVMPGPMVVTVDEEGETRVHDVFGLFAPVTGNLQRIEAHVGDAVDAGVSVLAQIEPVDSAFLDPRGEAQARAMERAAKSALELADASIEQAQAEFEFAQSEYRRARELVQSGTISARDLDSAERAYRASKAALTTTQAAKQMRIYELENAQAQLMPPSQSNLGDKDCDCISVIAPVKGRVLRIVDDSERIVSAGELLLEIGDPADMEVVVDFLSTDAVKVKPGQSVIIDRWGGPHPLSGTVRQVEPYGFRKVSPLGIEEQRVNVIIDFTGSYQSREPLGHGYQVEAAVVLWQSDNVLAVPLTSVFRSEKEWALFVKEEGRATLRTVKVGHRNGVAAEILEGLAPGDEVILYPSNRVSDGTRVSSR